MIVVWDPFQGKKTLKFELPTKPSISCMSSSPTRLDTIAIGYVSNGCFMTTVGMHMIQPSDNYFHPHFFYFRMDGGDIFVCKANLSGVFVQQRLHGHTERIHSLAWQPSRKTYDLATTLFWFRLRYLFDSR